MSTSKKDMKGMRFGALTVIEEVPERHRGNVVWRCECDCGNIKDIVGYNLRNGNTTSCGCKINTDLKGVGGGNRLDLKGKRFGKLIVERELPRNKYNYLQWDCVCDCGRSIVVPTNRLTSGTTKSCGCMSRSHLVGKKFGHLEVISELPDRHKGNIMWLCECTCGQFRGVTSTQLNTGRVTKCGKCHL